MCVSIDTAIRDTHIDISYRYITKFKSTIADKIYCPKKQENSILVK